MGATRPSIKRRYGKSSSSTNIHLQEILPIVNVSKRVKLDDFFNSSAPSAIPRRLKSSSVSSKANALQRTKTGTMTQLYLELGQKDFTSTTCRVCGMSFAKGSGNDDAIHKAFHRASVAGIDYTPTTTSIPIHTNTDGEIIQLVNMTKIKQVLNVVNGELQAVDTSFEDMSRCKVFAYILSKRIVGCVLAEDRNTATIVNTGTEAPVQCGISRIWVSQSNRRKGIASRLLDTVAECFFYGITIPKTCIAFSQPTALGENLARKWLDGHPLLIYA